MNILEIQNLHIAYPPRRRQVHDAPAPADQTALLTLTTPRHNDAHSRQEPIPVLNGVNLTLTAGEKLALVGESGSGKSTVGNAIGRLLPHTARYLSGTILVDSHNVLELEAEPLRRLRREQLGYIPQDPIASLDPTKRIGTQLRLLAKAATRAHDQLALEHMLEQVRIRDPRRVLRAYPHELSGGMAQRIAIALAIIRAPRILIADEPTAALDANVRRDVLALIFEVAHEHGSAVLWISHQLEAVGQLCDRVAVMQNGQIVEVGQALQVLQHPTHEYTKHLLRSAPARLKRERKTTA